MKYSPFHPRLLIESQHSVNFLDLHSQLNVQFETAVVQDVSVEQKHTTRNQPL